ncbi:MAG: ABC transporter ATP-binding protein [Clostridiales bacterium]|nr:ABC transporter ATP-binding protein [Clostridiales bacterium]
MISVSHVSKRYNKRDMVVDDVSFTVDKGTIFGLLGPNGAGKTTLMQMIATLLIPTSGFVTICGMDTSSSAQEIRKRIGFLTTEIKLDPLSTPNQLYDFFSELYDIPKDQIESRKQASFARFGIGPFADKRIAELSTGMKQKISIVISLIHDPQVIIFDEPTNGLDILTSRQVMDYLLELREKGCCVLLSTHIFSVAEQLCDEIAILVDGHIVSQGSAQQLTEQTGSRTFEEAFFKLYTEHHREG